ncbi:MAG TPA: hypothetical protein VHX12_05715 [Acidisoma sp.]|nr:hypothetical protein [Acidisoma sp.]
MPKHGSSETDPKSPGAKHGRAQPPAGSVDREPDPVPTPVDDQPAVRSEDEPKGHPNSDRFRTEQAHRKPGGKS